MFKEVTIYEISGDWHPTVAAMEEVMVAFTPCGATQDKSVGWVPPRGHEGGALVESVDGQRILKLMIETKSVPTSALEKAVDEAADHIESTTGRKPGRKERKNLKEDARLALLPAAFPKQTSVTVWIDHERKLIVMDSASNSKLDEVVSALVRAFDGLAISRLNTNLTPQTAMTSWLFDGDKLDDEDRFNLHIERECELRSHDEEKAVVKFSRHHLLTDEVRKHITEGKLPTRLALSWNGRVGFVLNDAMKLKKVAFLEGVFDERSDAHADRFDADVALITGELRKLIPDLIEALGGKLTVQGG